MNKLAFLFEKIRIQSTNLTLGGEKAFYSSLKPVKPLASKSYSITIYSPSN